MPEIILNAAGITRTTGTANPTITGDTGKSGSMSTVPTGTEVAYIRRYSSNKPGFENCTGIWRAVAAAGSIGYIERTSVELSSNNNEAVVWGVGEQTIEVTITPALVKSLPTKPQKLAGEPTLIVITGQSKATGLYPTALTTAMPINNGVKSWQTVNDTQSTGACEFVVADPKRAFTYVTSNLLIGMVGAYREAGATQGFPVGHSGWSAGDIIQKQTLGRVYIVSIARGAAAFNLWADGAEVEARLALEIPLAIAAIAEETGYTLAGPDLVILDQGETNAAFGTTAAAQATAFATFKTLVETKWAVKGFTQWAVCEFVQTFAEGVMVAGWDGAARFVDSQGPDVQFISSIGAEIDADDVHHTGDGQNEIGRRIAQTYLAGMTPKRTTRLASIYENASAAATLTGTEEVAMLQGGVIVTDTPINLRGNMADQKLGFDRLTTTQFTDFLETNPTLSVTTNDTQFGASPATVFLSGANASVISAGATFLYHGSAQCGTGSTNAGFAAVVSTIAPLLYVPNTLFFRMRFAVVVPALTGSGQEFTIPVGLSNNHTTGLPTLGHWFSYSQASANWFANSQNAGGIDSTDTGVAVVAGGRQVLRIDHDGVNTLFYINNTLEATHTRQMALFTPLSMGVAIKKTLGVTTRTVVCEAWRLETPSPMGVYGTYL